MITAIQILRTSVRAPLPLRLQVQQVYHNIPCCHPLLADQFPDRDHPAILQHIGQLNLWWFVLIYW